MAASQVRIGMISSSFFGIMLYCALGMLLHLTAGWSGRPVEATRNAIAFGMPLMLAVIVPMALVHGGLVLARRSAALSSVSRLTSSLLAGALCAVLSCSLILLVGIIPDTWDRLSATIQLLAFCAIPVLGTLVADRLFGTCPAAGHG